MFSLLAGVFFFFVLLHSSVYVEIKIGIGFILFYPILT